MSSSASKRLVGTIVGVVIVLAVVYGVRVAWLFAMATEGDVPASSSIPLPNDATIISEEKACANGGCWIVVSVEPPEGRSAGDLAATLGASPQLRIAGNFFDPRTISVQADSTGRALELRADYWSQEWIP